MTKIEKLLQEGDLRSAGNSEKVVTMVLKQPELFKDVINAILTDHAPTRMRATDAIEKITRENPALLAPYKKTFLKDIATIEQKEVRWHLAQILPRLKLTVKERQQVYDLMIQFLEDDSRIVKTFAMQALTDLAAQDVRYKEPVIKLVTRLLKTGAPSMQSRGKKLLVTLNNL